MLVDVSCMIWAGKCPHGPGSLPAHDSDNGLTVENITQTTSFVEYVSVGRDYLLLAETMRRQKPNERASFGIL